MILRNYWFFRYNNGIDVTSKVQSCLLETQTEVCSDEIICVWGLPGSQLEGTMLVGGGEMEQDWL